jgi:hypothetical protein
MTKLCKVCNELIPEGRLKALPGTETCTPHSTTTSYRANTVTIGDVDKDDHYQDIQIIKDPKALEELEHYRKQQGTYN